jgi:tRNA A37 threonylcarbamoyladenosine dehydratase
MNFPPEWLSRTELLLGGDNLQILSNAHVFVAGLGGVGAYAVEMLVRAGVGKLSIADSDKVVPSNKNRQLIALDSTIGGAKTELLENRLMDINPKLELTVYHEFLKDERLNDILEKGKYSYVVDAIDTLSPKIYLIYGALKNNLPVVSSMGAGGKLDPLQIRISDVSDSFNCKLAFVLRKRLRKLGVEQGFKVVFSTEQVSRDAIVLTDGTQNKKSNVGTISYIPAIFGCYCASVVIRDLIKA